MYFRKIRPWTTCLYFAASQSVTAKSRFVPEFVLDSRAIDWHTWLEHYYFFVATDFL